MSRVLRAVKRGRGEGGGNEHLLGAIVCRAIAAVCGRNASCPFPLVGVAGVLISTLNDPMTLIKRACYHADASHCMTKTSSVVILPQADLADASSHYFSEHIDEMPIKKPKKDNRSFRRKVAAKFRYRKREQDYNEAAPLFDTLVRNNTIDVATTFDTLGRKN